MSRHTPGPWELGPTDGITQEVIDPTDTDEDNPLGAMVCRDCVPDDARLIAAAPELLEAANLLLENIVDAGEYGPHPRDVEEPHDYIKDQDGDYWYSDAWGLRQAIAKATGEDA